MTHSICERCFHYAACSAIDVTGSVGNPECNPENENCEHFISSDMVKIQPKAQWIMELKTWYDGDVSVSCSCSYCGKREYVRMYKKAEWNDYYHEHYRDGLELPGFCKRCGSIVTGIV